MYCINQQEELKKKKTTRQRHLRTASPMGRQGQFVGLQDVRGYHARRGVNKLVLPGPCLHPLEESVHAIQPWEPALPREAI